MSALSRRLPVRRQVGFTLIEILIALFIFSILASVLAVAIKSILASRTQVQQVNRRLAAIELAEVMLLHDFTQICLLPIRLKQQAQPSVQGDAHSVQIIRDGEINPFALATRSSLLLQQFSVAKGKLIQTSRFIGKTLQPATSQPLLESVKQLNVVYISRDHRRYQHWPRTQQKPLELPIAIQLSLSLADWGMIRQTYVLGDPHD